MRALVCVCVRYSPIASLQDFAFRVRLSECLKEEGLFKDAAHTLAGYKKFVARAFSFRCL